MTKMNIFQGDITGLDVDAIVNAANNELWMGGGVAGAIRKAGGAEIETEAVKKGPIAIGEAVETGAGKLKASYVIHAAVMAMDFKTETEKIKRATRSSLEAADRLGVKSLAFPALGTGVGRFPVAEAARIMIGEVLAYTAGETGLEKIVFVLYSERAYLAFERELKRQGR
jgi:O-acetyl-ADP-ribose deacetylase (regulator of RNase III)